MCLSWAHYAGQGLLGNGDARDYLGSMPQTARLTDRALISVSGPEARAFLQGLITNDVEAVKPGQPIYAALLTPQGKILFDFLIFEQDGALLLDVSASQREALQKRLTMYRLRAKVDIAARDDLAVIASWGDGGTGSDPRHNGLGSRTVVQSSTVDGADDYLAHRLGLGIPESTDFGQDRMFALDADLDELHGVAFDKGCYVGQELTARMKHRGTARKRLLPVETLDGSPLPAVDSNVTAGGREIGTIGSVYGARGFALIRLDRLEEAGDAAAESGGEAVRITKPSWLFSPPPA
jgi:folate-binding protein YgfZ